MVSATERITELDPVLLGALMVTVRDVDAPTELSTVMEAVDMTLPSDEDTTDTVRGNLFPCKLTVNVSGRPTVVC